MMIYLFSDSYNNHIINEQYIYHYLYSSEDDMTYLVTKNVVNGNESTLCWKHTNTSSDTLESEKIEYTLPESLYFFDTDVLDSSDFDYELKMFIDELILSKIIENI